MFYVSFHFFFTEFWVQLLTFHRLQMLSTVSPELKWTPSRNAIFGRLGSENETTVLPPGGGKHRAFMFGRMTQFVCNHQTNKNFFSFKSSLGLVRNTTKIRVWRLQKIWKFVITNFSFLKPCSYLRHAKFFLQPDTLIKGTLMGIAREMRGSNEG